MKHAIHYIITVLLLCLPCTLAAQQTFRAHVADAETGEALPYARVQTGGTRGTMSNRDGDFSLAGAAEDVLTISYIGYETLTVKACELPTVIRLKPLAMEMGEVVIRPHPKADILRRIRKRLHREHQWKKHMTTLYFFRTFTHHSDGSEEMLEGFYNACSSINIRYPSIVSGQTRLNGGTEAQSIKGTNFQQLFSLGPIIFDQPFWKYALQPLDAAKDVQRAYDADITSIHDEEGRCIYKIEFLFNGWAPKDWRGQMLIQGTLYVDADTYRLQHFDGVLLGMRQTFDGARRRMDLTFHVDYSHERNFTEVEHISFDGGSPQLSYHCLLFKVDKGQSHYDPLLITSTNLMRNIRDSGYDQSLWEKYDIVRRTEEEERAAVKGKKGNMPKPLSVTK